MILYSGMWAVVGRFGQQILQLAVVVILARLITPSAFGIVAITQVILGVSQVFIQFGVGAALIQTNSLTRKMERSAQTLMLVIALMLGLALVLTAEWMSLALNNPELVDIMPVILVILVISAAINPSQNLLMRDMRFKLLATLDVLSYAFAYGGVGVSLAFAGYSYWALIIAALVQTTIKAVMLFYFRPVWPLLALSRSELGSLLNFGGGVFLAQLISEIAKRADNIVVAAMFGSAELGFYSRAYSLMDLANTLLGSAFSNALFSGFSKQKREALENGEKRQSFLMAHAFAALIILPISALMFLLSEEVIILILGERWQPAIPVLQVLSIGMYFRLAYKVSHAFNLAEGAVYQTAAFSVIYAVLVVLGAYFGSFYGLDGVAVGVLMAIFVQYWGLTRIALGYRCIGWPLLIRAVIPFFIAAGVALLASLPLHVWAQSARWPALALLITFTITYLFFYFTTLLLFRKIGFVASMLDFVRFQHAKRKEARA